MQWLARVLAPRPPAARAPLGPCARAMGDVDSVDEGERRVPRAVVGVVRLALRAREHLAPIVPQEELQRGVARASPEAQHRHLGAREAGRAHERTRAEVVERPPIMPFVSHDRIVFLRDHRRIGKAAAYRQGADPPLGATMAHLTAGLLGDVLVLGQPHASLVGRELLRDRAARRMKPSGESLSPLSDLRAEDELLDATEQARRACGRGQRHCRRPAAQTKRTKVKQCGLRLLS